MINITKRSFIQLAIIAVIPALVMVAAGCESFFNDIAGDPLKIAFVSNRTGTNNIFIMNADGSEQTQLTFDAAGNTTPRWSPDGSKIAFCKGLNIYIMDADGSNPMQITNGLAETSPSWSPDGTQLVYVNSPATTNFHIINIETKSVISKGLSTNVLFSYWSTKTNKIVCSQFILGVNEIVTMNPDSSGWIQLTSAGVDYVRPSWSPNGSKILFSGKNGGNDLFIMNADGTSVKQLTELISGIADYPSISPDGEQIAFEWDGTGTAHIYVMNDDGSNIQQLTFAGNNRQPCWSPE